MLSIVFRKADNERARKFVKRNFNGNLILTTKANASILKFVVLKKLQRGQVNVALKLREYFVKETFDWHEHANMIYLAQN